MESVFCNLNWSTVRIKVSEACLDIQRADDNAADLKLILNATQPFGSCLEYKKAHQQVVGRPVTLPPIKVDVINFEHEDHAFGLAIFSHAEIHSEI